MFPWRSKVITIWKTFWVAIQFRVSSMSVRSLRCGGTPSLKSMSSPSLNSPKGQNFRLYSILKAEISAYTEDRERPSPEAGDAVSLSLGRILCQKELQQSIPRQFLTSSYNYGIFFAWRTSVRLLRFDHDMDLNSDLRVIFRLLFMVCSLLEEIIGRRDSQNTATNHRGRLASKRIRIRRPRKQGKVAIDASVSTRPAETRSGISDN